MAKKAATVAERAHMGLVASLGCIVKGCGARNAQVHHLTGNKSQNQRASHYKTIPLCFNHHSAQTPLPFGHAVHKGTKTFEDNYGTQEVLLALTYKKLKTLYPNYKPKI